MITWQNRLGPRGRSPWLLLIENDNIFFFNGENIKGIAVIRGTESVKNGKWSHSTFRIETAENVRAISGFNGFETNKFVEGLRQAVSYPKPIDTWLDVADALGLSVCAAMNFLKTWCPKAAEELDAVDEALDDLDEAAQETSETVLVNFGAPSRKEREQGFWINPKPIPGYEKAEIRLIDTGQGWEKGNITIVNAVGKILSATHATGRGGGYVSVTLAIVPDKNK